MRSFDKSCRSKGRSLAVWVTCVVFCTACSVVRAQDAEESIQDESLAALDFSNLSITNHAVRIGSENVAYTATTGTLTMANESGEEQANIFFIAYERDGFDDKSDRPITFCFNGGPGSSSVWLHLGAYGPKRVDMGDAGALKAPPYSLVDNHESILDVSDLVFIDPVMTGYSRPAEGVSKSDFHGLNEDISSVAEFIRLYTTRFERWNSPKFLSGESYGTTRAAGLSGRLQDSHGMYLNGILLVSSILNFQTARFDSGNDLPYIVFMPTYAAINRYHSQDRDITRIDVDEFVESARTFAEREYASALMLGDKLPKDERAKVIKKLSYFTGISEQFIDQTNLRISIWQFTKELLRDSEQRTVGRLDGRFKGIDADATGSSTDYDPSMSAIRGPYTATLNEYVRSDLGFKSDLPYEILTGRVHPWSYRQYTNRYVNVASTLRNAMTRNQDLYVHVANGYYDLATPFFATEYTFNHLGLDPSLQDHVSMSYYESGHMFYIHEESRKKMKDDFATFYKKALQKK